MTGVLDLPRTIIVRGVSMRFQRYADLAAFADLQLPLLKSMEARMTSITATPEAWAEIAERAEHLVDICAAQDAWLADHDAELATEAEAVRASIRALDGAEPIRPSEEGR